ncbi:uncharacterized protein LOC108212841 [Daucus carota subsp. sativus]|uniref:uncharacterized protein LOC108212841 n=1 Tax=Daucus carota subsp. sativus TaxID=79200 RepID=UPI0007EFC4F1|nr:PREDICTED: uncharacterized protein LOC108212841 [Daucus carota subsp. sativus]
MCDGLLCISFDADMREFEYGKRECYCIGDNLYLWNPICRKSKRLPGLELSTSGVNFGQYGGVSFGYYGGDYKVMVISSSTGYNYFVSVYSLSSNRWNVIRTNCYYQEISDFVIKHPTKFVDGTVYMITATRRTSFSYLPLIVWFDLRDETIQQLKCPEEFVYYCSRYTIEAYGESIAVFGCGNREDERYLDMWTFLRDKDSSKSSWEKKLVIKLENIGYSHIPLGFLDNGRYMISRHSMKVYYPRMWKTTFLLCDLESQKVLKYGSQSGSDSHGSKMNPNCVESLLLLDEDSVDPFVHSEAESSCGSILFTLKKDIGHPTKCKN